MFWESFECICCEFWPIVWDDYFRYAIFREKMFRMYYYHGEEFIWQMTDIKEAGGIVDSGYNYGFPPRWKISIATFVHGVSGMLCGIIVCDFIINFRPVNNFFCATDGFNYIPRWLVWSKSLISFQSVFGTNIVIPENNSNAIHNSCFCV